MSAFVAARKQQNNGGPDLHKVNAVARPHVNSKFLHTFPHVFCVADMPCRKPLHAGKDSSTPDRVAEPMQPA